MQCQIKRSSYTDPAPKRISSSDWHELYKKIPQKYTDQYRYYRHLGKNDWNTYTFPPSSYLIYGSRYLRKLKFDNSLAALRLWGFMLSESERLFRARQSGKKLIANMGDLGSVPPLVYSFPDTIPFYPDCYWWTPFMNESTVLFEGARRHGIGEDCCFVRAALGAFSKLAYFPVPDLCIAATGASCDDMASVMQNIERLGHKFHWFELPHRKDKKSWFVAEKFAMTNSGGIEYQKYIKLFIIEEFNELISQFEKVTGLQYVPERLKKTLVKINKLRTLIREIKDLTFTADSSPLPALEIMIIEFMALSAYSDLEEAVSILEHMKDTIEKRINKNDGVTDNEKIRIAWVTPPADPLLLNYLEDLGGRLVATEFVINQALFPLQIEKNPIRSLADGMLNSSLMGTAKSRALNIINEAKRYDAEGVIISNIFASSHCAFETSIIKDQIHSALNIPVLTFDVVAPGKQTQQSQILNRMTAFIELLKEKKR